MSYDISSYTNSSPRRVASSPNHSDNNNNTIMRDLYQARQQQQPSVQPVESKQPSAMERYHSYLQKQALQQQVYQGIPDPIIQSSLQTTAQQSQNPPEAIEIQNPQHQANNNRPANNPTSSSPVPDPWDQPLSPNGIPDDTLPRNSKVLRVDFSGSITNGDNLEVGNTQTAWRNAQNAQKAMQIDTSGIMEKKSLPPTHPSTRSSPPHSSRVTNNRGAMSTTRPPQPSNGGTKMVSSPPKPQRDFSFPKSSNFNPDIVVGVGGNTRLSYLQQQQQQAQNQGSNTTNTTTTTTTDDTTLNRASSDSSGTSSSTAANSFGKTPTLAMFYPSPVRPTSDATSGAKSPSENKFLAIAQQQQQQVVAANKNTRSFQKAAAAAASNTRQPIPAAPSLQEVEQESFQQQQQQLQEIQQEQDTFADEPQPKLLQVPTTMRRQTSPKPQRKVAGVQFAQDPPTKNNESQERDPMSRLDGAGSLGTVQEGAPTKPKSALRNAQTTTTTTTPAAASGASTARSRMNQSVIIQERKEQKLASKMPPPPPPPEPKLTHWEKRLEKLEDWWRKPPKYRPLKLLQFVCGIYIVVMSFTYVGTLGNVGGLVDPESGYIIDIASKQNTEDGVILVNGDYRAVVARSTFQMIALAISRLSAFTMYPALIVVFFSKFRATMNVLSSTYLGQLFIASDLHDIHVYCGHYILVDGCLHTIFHTARWAAQGNLYLLVKNPSGISGSIVIVSTLLICLPMMYAKRKVAYEIRKATHYLFLLFALAMCFHVPTSGFPNGGFAPYVFGILLAWWILDSMVVQWFLTEKIQSSRFYVLPSGVQLTMAVSERFQSWGTGGFCYVCLPWVNPYQWHAFSLFENPTEPSERQIFMQKLGNWTTQVHDMLGRETSRPVWVSGPFTSPYGNADNYDNQILVAGGIGITPALSVIRQLKDTRRCNLIWSTRDRHMLEFFIKHADLSHKGWNLVFYTGKEQLLGIEDVVVTGSGATIHIIRARPKLHWVIPNIIYGIESGTSMPEQFIPDDKIVAMELLQEKLIELEGEKDLDSHEKLSELVNYCDELGYLFSDLISTLPNHEQLTRAESLQGMKNKSNRSVLDAILNFNNDVASPRNSQKKGDAGGDRRNMFAGQKKLASVRASSRNMLYNASRRKIGSGGLRRRRVSFASSSFGNERGSGTRGRESISTSTWGALAASVHVVAAMKGLGGLESLNKSQELDVETAQMPSMYEQLDLPFKPWDYNKEAEDYVKKMGEDELSTWGVLYCGGKSPLYRALQKAARKANVEMHEESFAW